MFKLKIVLISLSRKEYNHFQTRYHLNCYLIKETIFIGVLINKHVVLLANHQYHGEK
jgi:hypothetical protein